MLLTKHPSTYRDFPRWLKFIVVLSLFISYSCKKDHRTDCFKSTGDLAEEHRTLQPVNRLHISDNIEVIVHPGSSYHLKVRAGQNLLNGIITEQTGNTLYIRNENRCNWVRKFGTTQLVEVYVDTLEKIEYYGSGDLHFADTLRMYEFTFDSWNGSGTLNFLLNTEKSHFNNNLGRPDIHVSGKSNVSFVYMNDVGAYFGAALKSDLCYIRNRSTGHCYIRVEKELEAELEYSGNIYYSGQPYRIEQRISSTGELIHVQ